MGLYDHIKCNYPLDKKHIQNEQFQTKSLNCLMEEYEITEGGWLFKKCEMVEGWDFNQLDEPEIMKVTGEIVFYTFRTRKYEDKHKTYWYEYSAYFKGGKLKELNSQHENWNRANTIE